MSDAPDPRNFFRREAKKRMRARGVTIHNVARCINRSALEVTEILGGKRQIPDRQLQNIVMAVSGTFGSWDTAREDELYHMAIAHNLGLNAAREFWSMYENEKHLREQVDNLNEEMTYYRTEVWALHEKLVKGRKGKMGG